MSIEVVDKNIAGRFPGGEIVYRITACDAISDSQVIDRNVNIVTSLEDYKKKLHSHLYSPLLFICDFPTRIAYLHGCLNYSFNQPRSEVYTFWWREIGTDQWDVWFRVKPHNDSDTTIST
uniref:Uncharacterized protein n=1 Tax=Marseillevirus LCMAC101 TaxID=2506602 RepID=A0A481YU14_9VIRU|nr:MAG: hypothetical protein LCMAC101_06090 [Marseillevirus LCMAC101]